MIIYVNNKTEKIDESELLSHFLIRIHLNEKKGIAIAVNNVVIANTNWNNYVLKENDRLTIIQATQGG